MGLETAVQPSSSRRGRAQGHPALLCERFVTYRTERPIYFGPRCIQPIGTPQPVHFLLAKTNVINNFKRP
jgi:hypothetical protein